MNPENLKLDSDLYLVPTPIGNLRDITLRAIDVLSAVDLILAEDTRNSGKLLKHLEIKKPMQSYHAHNEHHQVGNIIKRLQQGEKIALISDAGMPAISDPGYLIVRACLQENIKIECLPGASAILPALVKSGFPTDRFVFEGFLPHKKGRQTKLRQLAEEERTIVLYESPHRLLKLMEQIREWMGPERLVSVSRELTKLYEETVTGTPDEVTAHFGEDKVKGEIVVVLSGKQ